MTEKEIGEIRRRVRRDRSNMTSVFGCYVSGQKEILTEFEQSTAMMPENEAEKYFALLKRCLSGTLGKNLIDLPFKTSQVADSPEHKLLMRLRETSLKDAQARNTLYKKIIETVSYENGYLILAGCETYDVPFKSRDGEEQADASGETYQYILCAICPVKLTKADLRYDGETKAFHDGGAANVACAPEMGFLFPAFDDRATNIYNVLFYSRSPKDSHSALVENLFHIVPPKCAMEQKQSFEALLTRSLDAECSMEVMQSVHDDLCQSIAMHKESKIAQPLLISKEQVKASLTASGVSDQGIAKFSVDFDEAFGNDALLHPKNIIDNKHFDINTPDVSIRVSPEKSDLIETRVIGGVKYILICADENVEVNGVPIHIRDNTES